MYLEFFGLQTDPFSLASDPSFLYYSESHCEAMAHLLYGVRERKGVILLLGEAGTGKTTLVKATLDLLRSTRVVPSLVMNPMISTTEELLESILAGFGLQGFRKNNLEMSEVLQRYLLKQHSGGRIPVLIIDEAQELSAAMLNQVRMLSNYEYEGQKLLQVIFAAQPEMGERIDSYELRALRQRIVVRSRLGALSAGETWNYISSRLVRAGISGAPVFTPEAVETVYSISGGIPRVINILADNCLVAAYAQGINPVTPTVVSGVARHMELVPLNSGMGHQGSIHQDVLRASNSWKEIVSDLRKGSTVPAPLREYIEKLRTPEETEIAERALTTAAQRGH